MRPVLTVSLTVLTAVAACSKGRAPVQAAPEPRRDMHVVTEAQFVLADNAPVFGDTAHIVIRDSVQWRRIWQQAISKRQAAPPLPAVDFGREMIVLVTAGLRKPGDVIHVDSIGTKGTETIIVVRTTVGCQNIATDAYPFEIARLPRTDGQIQWVDVRSIIDCP